MPPISTTFPLLDEILAAWQPAIGADFAAYGNHIRRVLNFTLALHPCSAEELERLQVAGAFHDLGIWSDGTFDYLPPSIARARDYLAGRGLEGWVPEVSALIGEHHKIRAIADPALALVEAFRKADLVDVSLGLVRFGLPREFVRAVKAQFPDAGFHGRLVQLTGANLLRHPLRPAPFFKW
ncbi:hypothetical protein [Zavarzinia sp.]|uniref:hypothetical protein n=1 Tax=Zavarzinia sp. TaxID=2027920 RepID=UPI003561894A